MSLPSRSSEMTSSEFSGEFPPPQQPQPCLRVPADVVQGDPVLDVVEAPGLRRLKRQFFAADPEAAPAKCPKDDGVVLKAVAHAEFGEAPLLYPQAPHDLHRDAVLVGLGKTLLRVPVERIGVRGLKPVEPVLDEQVVDPPDEAVRCMAALRGHLRKLTYRNQVVDDRFEAVFDNRELVGYSLGIVCFGQFNPPCSGYPNDCPLIS